jgi:hypothetical protein
MKLTRRELAAVLAPAAALAQTAASVPAADPGRELQAARDRLKSNAETLAHERIPMATEPAFQFKA